MAFQSKAVFFCAVWAYIGVAYGLRAPWKTDKVTSVTKTPIRRYESEFIQPILQPGDLLEICECEDASLSSHGGLQCEREGWFIYSFEAVGRWVRLNLSALC
jgi:hypothetical protein